VNGWAGKNMKTATCHKVKAVFNGMDLIKTISSPNRYVCEKEYKHVFKNV